MSAPFRSHTADFFYRTRYGFAVVMTILNILDVITTKYVLSKGAVETNPILAPFVDGYAWIGVKALMVAWFCYACVTAIEKENSPISKFALVAGVCFYTYVVVNNLIVMWQI